LAFEFGDSRQFLLLCLPMLDFETFSTTASRYRAAPNAALSLPHPFDNLCATLCYTR
jgi:hypothetical protein